MWKIANGLQTVSDCGRRSTGRPAARPRHLRSCPTHAARSGIAGAGSDGTAFPPLANPPVAPRESALLHSALFPLPLALPLFPLFITKLDHKKFQHCGCALNEIGRASCRERV